MMKTTRILLVQILLVILPALTGCGPSKSELRAELRQIEGEMAAIRIEMHRHRTLMNQAETDALFGSFAAESTGKIFAETGLAWGWEGVPFAERVTWPGDGTFPDACFDHLHSRELGNAGCVLVPGSEMASDHRGIILGFDRVVDFTQRGGLRLQPPGKAGR